MSNLQDTLNTIQDQTGDTKLYRETVLDHCYVDLFNIIVNGDNAGYDKELIIKQAKETLLQTRKALELCGS